MKSLNMKNVAALATGVAMVGSVIAPAFAAVDVGDGVNDFVQLIKENPENTYAVVGSLADVSDAIAAADFVDALKEATASESTVTGTAGGVTIKGTSGSVSLTPAHYDVEYIGTGNGLTIAPYGAAPASLSYGARRTGYAAAAGVAGTAVTITPDVLPDVLYRGNVEAYVTTGAGATAATQLQKYEYQEEVILGGLLGIKYEASDSPIGHGLYLYAPGAASGVNNALTYGISDQISYKLNFARSGLGLPMNNTTWKKTPVIQVLKKEYAMDVVAARQTAMQFVLYPGEAIKMLSGETYTTDDGYKVTLEDVGLQGANTGALYVNVRVDSPDGDFERLSLDEKQGATFFNDKVSVYVDSATGQTYTQEGQVTGRADLRIGHGKLYFNVGGAFPLDDLWTVTEVGNLTNTVGTSTTNYLRNVTIRYGSPLKATPKEKGNFLGNEYSGLKEGIVLDGPKNYDGTPVFNIKLSGFGGATKVDTTDVIVTGAGSISNAAGAITDMSVINVKWTDRGGLVNNFAPSNRAMVSNSSAGVFLGSVIDNIWTTTRAWGIVAASKATGNYHVLYFHGTEQDTTGQMRAKFSIGGQDGNVIYSTPVAAVGAAAAATLTYSDIVDQMTCALNIDAADRVTMAAGQAACDVMPSFVVVGSDLVMDRGTVGAGTRPNFDFTNVTGGVVGDGTGAATALLPMVYYNETMNATETIANGKNATIVFDSTTATNYLGNAADANHPYTGLVVAPRVQFLHAPGPTIGGVVSDIDLSTGNITAEINTALYPVLERNAHYISTLGTEYNIDKTPGANVLTITVPEAPRNAVITVAETLTEGDTSADVTYKVGDVLPDGSVVTAVGASGEAKAKAYKNVPSMIYDSQATGTYQVVIGGPWVNTVAQAIAGNEKTTVAAGQGYLMVDGKKLLAAGMTGTDTTEAVNKLIDLLSK